MPETAEKRAEVREGGGGDSESGGRERGETEATVKVDGLEVCGG